MDTHIDTEREKATEMVPRSDSTHDCCDTSEQMIRRENDRQFHLMS